MDTLENDLLLIKSALIELESSITDTHFEPKSISLLFLDLGIKHDIIGKLIIEFNNLLLNSNLLELDNMEILDIFREKISLHIEQANHFDNMLIYKIIRAFANSYIPSLLEISQTLKYTSELNFKI